MPSLAVMAFMTGLPYLSSGGVRCTDAITFTPIGVPRPRGRPGSGPLVEPGVCALLGSMAAPAGRVNAAAAPRTA